MPVPVSAARISGEGRKIKMKRKLCPLGSLPWNGWVSGNQQLGQMTFGLPPPPNGRLVLPTRFPIDAAASVFVPNTGFCSSSSSSSSASYSFCESNSLAMPAMIRFYCHRFSLSYVLWHVVRLLPLDSGNDNNDVA